MRVLVFQGYLDPERRPPEELLVAWPTLPGVAEGIARAGATVEVVVAAHADQELEREGVRYRFVRERYLPSPRRILGHRAAPHPRRSLHATTHLRADVVHLHGLSFPGHAAALRRLHPGAVLVAQDHADRPPRGRLRRVLHGRGLACLDGVFFTATAQADPFVRAGLLGAGTPVFGVPEGSTRFTPGDRAAARRALGLERGPVVAWVGRLVRGKDPHTALDAFLALAAAHRGAVLAMAFRGGALEEEVRSRVRTDPRLRDGVRLLGALPHEGVETLLRAADAFLSASHHEGSGYALVEALACGTPAAVTSIPPHRALLGGAGAGATAPVGDAPGLARAVETMLEGGAAARAAARERFDGALSFEAIGRRSVAAYETLLAARSSPAARRPEAGTP